MAKRAVGDGRGREGGRAKGTPNKSTALGRSVAEAIITNNYDKAQKMLDEIVDPKAWTWCYLRYLEFVAPKKAAVNVSDDRKKVDLHSELLEMAQRETKRIKDNKGKMNNEENN